MSFLEGRLGDVAAFCVGTAAVAFGDPTGAIEATVGAAGLVGFVLGHSQKFGPECQRVRRHIQSEILQNYQDMISGSDGNSDAEVELQAADDALRETLGQCVIDRKVLAASAVTPAGFPAQAVVVVMAALAKKQPDLFSPQRSGTLAHRFARDVIHAGIEAAVADADYYRQLEPNLMLEMAKAVGGIRENLDEIKLEQARQGELQRDAFVLLQQITEQLGIKGGVQALDAQVSRLELELNTTRSDLLALLTYIVGQGITADQIPSALATAKTNLDNSRAELENLRSLANEVLEIGPHLATARAALDNQSQIDLDTAQESIRKAKAEYRQAISVRRDAEALNMARLSEAEASIALARSDFLEAARLFAEAADELPEAEKFLATENRLKRANALYEHGSRFGGLLGLKQAIDTYRAALTVYTKKDKPAEWAATQNSLGNALQSLGDSEGGEAGRDNLKQAVDAYRTALIVRTEKHMPADWAATQNNLGIVLQSLGDSEGGEAGRDNLKQAVDAYMAALTVFTKKDMPTQWSATQNNLGIALQSLGSRQGGEAGRESLEQAVIAYSAALAVRTEKDMPADWAATQNNLGIALRSLGDRRGGEAGRDSLKQAVDAYRAALTVHTENNMPAQWATTQNNLGNALQSLGNLQGGEAGHNSLKQAVDAHRAALTVQTERDMPAQWAMTQNNLGNALQSLGNLEEGEAGRDSFKQAIFAFWTALTVFTKKDMPTQWAATQNNLGLALQSLGDREGGEAGRESLEQAVIACSAALTIRNKKDMPADWAATQNNLGIALRSLGDRRGGEARSDSLRQAVEACRAALTVYTENNMPAQWAMTQNNLGNALQSLGNLRGERWGAAV